MRADLLLRPVIEVQVEEDRIFGGIDFDPTVHLIPAVRLVGLGLQGGLDEGVDAENAPAVLVPFNLGLLHARRTVRHFRT